MADEEVVAMTTAPPRSPGTVVWVDLSTNDVDGAALFYEALLGWTYDRQESPMGTYVLARMGDDDVAGAMATPAPGIPPSWTVIIGTEHLDADLAAVTSLGGTVLQPPITIPGGARIATVADPAGAVLALMQSPPSDRGMAWGTPGAVTWVECLSRAPAASQHFYEELFGWKGEDGAGGYVLFHHDGEHVAGLMTMPPNVPPEAPSYWLVYFAVDDIDAAIVRTLVLGGKVLVPVRDIDEGRFAVFADPSGAVFAVLEHRER
jgi:predicted enzyme related to lactoylglutathione lyase